MADAACRFAESAAGEAHIFPVMFGEDVVQVKLYYWGVAHSGPGAVTQWVIEHPGFYPCGVGQVYCNDGNDRPFASDASKYALFCAAVGQAILNECFGELQVLHLHDWHAAMLAVLRAYDPHYARLKSIHTVYSIHNLSLQGVRPFKGDKSSLQTWFPHLNYDQAVVCDPRVTHCFNPMRAAIALAVVDEAQNFPDATLCTLIDDSLGPALADVEGHPDVDRADAQPPRFVHRSRPDPGSSESSPCRRRVPDCDRRSGSCCRTSGRSDRVWSRAVTRSTRTSP